MNNNNNNTTRLTVFFFQRERRPDATEGAGFHYGHAVAQQVRLVHQVRGHHHRPAFPFRLQNVPQSTSGRRVHTRRGFVH